MNVLQPEMITRLQVLSVVAEMAARSSSGDVGGRALLEGLPDSLGVTAGALEDHVRLLEHQGFVKGVFTMGGLASVFIQPLGKDAAAQFERQRRDPVRRIIAARDDVLRWAYISAELNGITPVAGDFLDTRAGYLGVPYTEAEVEGAARHLRTAELIHAGSWELTDAGRQVVEGEESVRDIERGAVYHTTHITGSTNVSVASSHVTQTAVTHPHWSDEVLRLLEVVEQSIVALPEGIAGSVRPLLEEARDSAEREEPSLAKRALNRITDILSDSAAGALGGHLATQIPQVLAMMG
ncbi:hypothetical protein [Microbacterium laevaniformans]|uniref:hypothetical protein n=1 Tax=Microbacterium laevaniformans TaxID=36807 RepID=UPI00363E7A28